MSAPRQEPGRGIRIGMWGSSGSGKTTYLGALRIAAHQAASRSQVNWAVIGDEDSAPVLAGHAGTLVNERQFPEPTFGLNPLRWQLVGERRGGPSGRHVVRFDLEVLDPSGKLTDERIWGQRPDQGEPDLLDFDIPDPSEDDAVSPSDRLVNHLAGCDGILYLFDPVSHEAGGGAFVYFNYLLAQIEMRTSAAGRMDGVYLPHHLAFCVSKFDDKLVFEKAVPKEERERMRGAPAPVRVPQAAARWYIDAISKERPNGTARHVLEAVMARFDPDRVGYFPMSAVGFFIPEDGGFDPENYSNVVDNGVQGVRGQIYPMYVLEPLVWLVTRIQKSRRNGPRP